MSLHAIRPEDRSRGTRPGAEWADTVPACFRSEGFAEDLQEGQAESGPESGPARASRRWGALRASPWRGAAPSIAFVLASLIAPFAGTGR